MGAQWSWFRGSCWFGVNTSTQKRWLMFQLCAELFPGNIVEA